MALRAATISGPQIGLRMSCYNGRCAILRGEPSSASLRRPIWEESHGMVQSEYIDSRHSNSKLGTSSGAIIVIWLIYKFII